MSNDGLSAEVHFAQRLAGNDKKTRDRAVKRLRKWLEIKATATKGGLSEDDFIKIWKGLHYCMWMSDKPLIQEELASSISGLIHAFKSNDEVVFSFIRTFFQTEAREWSGIDRWRIDKFMMLIRRFLHQCFVYLRNRGWESSALKSLTDIIWVNILDGTGEYDVPDGLKYHFLDIYMDELSQAGAAMLTEVHVQSFLDPICQLLPKTKSKPLLQYIITHLFEKLMNEEVERQKQETDSSEDCDETSHLQVNFKSLADKLFELAQSKKCLSRNRPSIYQLVTRLRNVSDGILPPEPEELSDDDDPIKHNDIASAVRKLHKLDEHLINNSLMTEKKKQRKAHLKAIVAEELQAQKILKRQLKDGGSEQESVIKKKKTEERNTTQEILANSKNVKHKGTRLQSKIVKPESAFSKQTVKNTSVTNKFISNDKKKKKTEINSSTLNVNNVKKMKKGLKKKVEDDVIDKDGDLNTVSEEVEIWIPNKKYKGPLKKGVSGNNVEKAAKSKQPVAYFESGVKTPPAFVRKAYTKLRTPKTEPTKKAPKTVRVDLTPASTKKRVSFNLGKNKSQDFEDSFTSSPLVYQPESKPDQSILKSPVLAVKPSSRKRLQAHHFF